MPQPKLALSGNLVVAKFGNSPLPNGQGTLSNVDLNDAVTTVLEDVQTQDDNRQIGLEQLLYRSKGVYTADDFGPRKISLPMTYYEDTTHFLGQFLAALSQAGEQQLTFDNVTFIPVKFAGASNRALRRRFSPFVWSFSLDLVAKTPWFQDLSATTMGALTLTVDTGQNFNITYAGSVFCEPVWTLVIPAGNAVAINQMQLKNTMSGETLTVNFQSVAPIPASTARTVTIDTAAQTVTDNVGNNYDVFGSFPKLYPPVGKVNPFTVVIVPASGASSGLTLDCSHFPRWQI